MKITEDIRYIGVNDTDIDLFEGQYAVPQGMSYNSYLILDEKTAVMDTVDRRFGHEWLDQIQKTLGTKSPDYLVIQHMEPDHSANIANFMKIYADCTIVSSTKAFQMMENFFGTDYADRRIVVKEGDSLTLGKHVLSFVAAPMVHWPEVILTYDLTEKVLFSADAFGRFGTPEADVDWAKEGRRYYIGIVGKYGPQVQNVLKKAEGLDIRTICPLHGPVLNDNLGYYLNLYKNWSSYDVGKDGVMIAYTSVYGHTKKAVELLEAKLKEYNCPDVKVYDLARCDLSEAVADAFSYRKLILATTTYNAGIFPFMREFIEHLTERNFQNRQIGMVENGSWAPMAIKTMKSLLEGSKNITYTDSNVHIRSAVSEENLQEIDALAKEIAIDYLARADEMVDRNDPKALFNIGYGLYVVTSNDGSRDNGLIVNTVSQVTNTPNRVMVCINKDNYSYHIIKQSGKMNVNCLSTDAPFKVFETFGFQSGRTVNKFADIDALRSENGLVYLPRYINAFFSLEVEQHIDLGTHGMFICSVTESRSINRVPTMTYTYYQENVKPKPQTEGKKGWVCKVCGYVYEGEELPDDIVCPLCKHGAADFEKIQ